MRGFRGFGEIPNVDLKNYKPVTIPASVQAYNSGHFLPGQAKSVRRSPEWSVKWPGNDSSSKAETLSYEDTMKTVINGALAAFKNFKPGDPTLKAAQKISQDLYAFKDYNQIKNQDLFDLVTMDATNKFYSTYFGSFENYRQLNAWLSDQSALAGQEMMDNANLLVADMNMGVASVKQKFYREKIVPIAGRFSQSDQGFLRDVFLFQLEGETTLEDLVKAIKMIAPHMTFADLTPIMQFGMQMVLGNSLGSDVLNAEVTKSYYDRNVNEEVAQIQGKYSAVASRIGRWLPKGTDELFQQRITIWRGGYADPNDARYYVCGQVCDQISQNLINGVAAGISEAIGAGNTPTDSSGINQRAISAIQAAITPDMSIDQATEVGKRIAAQISSDALNSSGGSNSAGNASGGGFGLLLIGAALFLFMKGRK